MGLAALCAFAPYGPAHAGTPGGGESLAISARVHSRILAGHPYGDAGATSGFAVGNGRKASQARFGEISGIAVDGAGNVFVADNFIGAKPQSVRCQVREIVHASNHIRAVVGRGSMGRPDGEVRTRRLLLNVCGNVGYGPSRGLLVATRLLNSVRYRSVILEIRPGTKRLMALLAAPTLGSPNQVAIDRHGSILIADSAYNRVLELTKQGRVRLVAGAGASGYSGGYPGYSGDGGPAVKAHLDGPTAVAVDAYGNIYIGDNGNQRIRVVSATSRKIRTVAGGGPCYAVLRCGNDVPGSRVQVQVDDIALDACDNLYIAAGSAGGLRELVARTGIIRSLVGPAVDVTAVTVYRGRILFADSGRHVLRVMPDRCRRRG